VKLQRESDGVETGLELIVPESESKSKQYLLWQSEIPFFYPNP